MKFIRNWLRRLDYVAARKKLNRVLDDPAALNAMDLLEFSAYWLPLAQFDKRATYSETLLREFEVKAPCIDALLSDIRDVNYGIVRETTLTFYEFPDRPPVNRYLMSYLTTIDGFTVGLDEAAQLLAADVKMLHESLVAAHDQDHDHSPYYLRITQSLAVEIYRVTQVLLSFSQNPKLFPVE